jgi:hypothetical protein
MGKQVMKDGNIYTGSFYKGRWDGLGELQLSNGSVIQGCIWAKGRPEEGAIVQLVWPSGRRISGVIDHKTWQIGEGFL